MPETINLLLDHLINILLAIGVVIGFWGIGNACWRLFFPQLQAGSLSAVFQFGLGALFSWVAIFVCGLWNIYQAWVAYVLFGFNLLAAVVAGLAEYKQLSYKELLQWWPKRGYEQLLLLICTVIIILAAIGALTPPAAQDALVHHLAIPKTYIKMGGLNELPYNSFSYFPAGMEMLFLYGLLLGGAGVATLLHYSFGLATFLTLLASRDLLKLSTRARLIAGTAFLTAPTIWMEMTWAYIDLGITFFVTLWALAVLGFRKQADFNWLKLAGVMLGAALSVKYTALFLLGVFPLLVLFILREHKQERFSQVAISLSLPLLIVLLVSAPWLIRNFYYTSNPLFPFFLNIIPSHNLGWDKERAALVLIVLKRYGGEGKTLLDYLLLPFRLSFFAQYESVEYYQGILGQFYLFTLPLLVMVKRVCVEMRYLLLLAIAFFLFWTFSSQQVRYLLPILPVLALTIASMDDWLTAWVREKQTHLSLWLQRIVLALALLVFSLNLGWIIYYFNNFDYGNLFLGSISAADYLRGKFDYYPYYEYINNNLPTNSRIFLIDMSNQSYYLEREFFSDAVFEDYTIGKIVANANTTQDIREQLKAMGITHLLYRPPILFGPRTSPFTDKEKTRLFIQFLTEYNQLLMMDKEQQVALTVLN